MNANNIEPMEGEIQSEENFSASSVDNKAQKPNQNLKVSVLPIKTKIQTLIKSTKLKNVFMLVFVLIVTMVVLLILANRKTGTTDLPPNVAIATPEAQVVQQNPETRQIESDLDDYDQKIDNLGDNISPYQPPIIDLDVKF